MQSLLSCRDTDKSEARKNLPQKSILRKDWTFLFESCILVIPALLLVPVSMAVSDKIFVKTATQTSLLIKLIYFKLLPFFLFQGLINLATAAGLGSSPFSSLFFVPSSRTVVMIPYLFYFVSFDFIFMKLCQEVSHKSTQISLVFTGIDTNNLLNHLHQFIKIIRVLAYFTCVCNKKNEMRPVESNLQNLREECKECTEKPPVTQMVKQAHTSFTYF